MLGITGFIVLGKGCGLEVYGEGQPGPGKGLERERVMKGYGGSG